jgi:predicted extracellular nuclease
MKISKFILPFFTVAVAMAKQIQEGLNVTCEGVPGIMVPDEAAFFALTLVTIHNSVGEDDDLTYDSAAVTEQEWHHKETKWAKQANLRANSTQNVGTGIWSTSYATYRVIITGNCSLCRHHSLGEFSPSTHKNFEKALAEALVDGASHFPYFAKIDACTVDLTEKVELIEMGSSVAPESE